MGGGGVPGRGTGVLGVAVEDGVGRYLVGPVADELLLPLRALFLRPEEGEHRRQQDQRAEEAAAAPQGGDEVLRVEGHRQRQNHPGNEGQDRSRRVGLGLGAQVRGDPGGLLRSAAREGVGVHGELRAAETAIGHVHPLPGLLRTAPLGG